MSARPIAEHLLLAATETPGELVFPLGETREQGVDPLQRLALVLSGDTVEGTEVEIALDAHRREEPSFLGDDGYPGTTHPMRRNAGHVWSSSTIRPRRGRRIPMIELTNVDFPAPLGPTMETTSPLLTVIDTSQRAWASP